MTEFDYIMQGVVVISTASGYSRGFFKSLAGFISAVAGTIFGVVVSRPLARIIYDTSGLREIVENYVDKQVSGAFQQAGESGLFNLQAGLEVLSGKGEVFSRMVSSLDAEALELVAKQGKDVSEPVSEMVSAYMGFAVISGMSLVLFFLLSGLAAGLLMRFLDISSLKRRIPAIDGLDKLLGLLLGAVKGCVFVVVLCIVLGLAVAALGESGKRSIVESRTYSAVQDVYGQKRGNFTYDK